MQNYELRITNYELRITNYELRINIYILLVFSILFFYLANFLFSLIELQSASPMNIAHTIHVRVSEIWNNVPRYMIAARANIAQNAPCSRYLYWFNVHFLTSIIVKLLTNIAPIQSHNAMMKIFLLSAKAPITPSKEKLASNTSR